MKEIRGTWNADFSHAHERMKVAVESLIGTGTLRKRLIYAVDTMYTFLRKDEFPEELRGEYADIIAECTKISPTGHESAYDATISRMGYQKKKQIAGRIVDLYDKIATEYILPDSLYPR